MKKLKLKSIALTTKEVLTRAQLKKIMGGGDDDNNPDDGATTCDSQCLIGCRIKCGGEWMNGDCYRQTGWPVFGGCICAVAC